MVGNKIIAIIFHDLSAQMSVHIDESDTIQSSIR